MALLNAVVLKSKEIKGGRNKVRIAVAHNGETRYIVTDIILNSTKEFKNGAVVKRTDASMLNVKIRGLLQRYQSTLDELEYIDGLNCPELVFQLKNAGNYKHRTIQSIFEEYIENARISPGSVSTYNRLWNVLGKLIGDKLLVEHVTHNTVLFLDRSLRARGIKSGTLKNYLLFFKTLLNYAQKCGYVQYRVNPYFGYKMPDADIRNAWLTVEDVCKIRDLNTKKRNIRLCRDLFMLSYYLGGINIVDLIKINFNEHPEMMHYVRQKTENRVKFNKFVEFQIPEEAKTIIARWKGADGKLAISDYQRKDSLNGFFRINMRKLAELTGIKYLIYYSARKSFSQHAFNLGINTSVIDYILGHRVDKGGTSLYNYITVTPEMATKAVRQVLDNLK